MGAGSGMPSCSRLALINLTSCSADRFAQVTRARSAAETAVAASIWRSETRGIGTGTRLFAATEGGEREEGDGADDER